MTPTDYRNAGFKVSMQLEQAIITRHENIVLEAYVKPILPNETLATTDADVKGAIMALAFLSMQYDNVFVTRSGAKGKVTPINSEAKTTETIMSENVNGCDRLLDVLRAKSGAVKDAKVNDVLRIYFITNYFYK